MNRNNNIISEDTQKNIKRVFLIIGYLFFAIAIVSFAIFFFSEKNKIKNSNGWEEAKCTILTRAFSARSRKNHSNYYWLLRYKYEFDGKEHTSAEYSLLESGPYIGRASRFDKEFMEKVKNMVDRNSGPYAKGSIYNCYVNPDNPEESLLVLVQPTILNTFISLYGQVWQVFICTIIFLVGIIFYRCGVGKMPGVA